MNQFNTSCGKRSRAHVNETPANVSCWRLAEVGGDSPLLAQNRHPVVTPRCPLWRAKPTWRIYEYTLLKTLRGGFAHSPLMSACGIFEPARSYRAMSAFGFDPENICSH
jgi:hypothetical protein